MILAIDAGNTRLKWGLREAGRWLDRQALPTAEAMRLAAQRAGWPPLDGVFVCCVAGPAVEATIAAILAPLAGRIVWCRSGAPVQGGLVNRYANPAQLGADRWLAAIGAWGLVGDDCLVVNAGTATTIDVLRRLDGSDGHAAEFAGGVILPGLALMRSSLARNTAQLPLACGVYLGLPRCTDDAIETGCIEAQVGAIERLATRLPPGSPCVLSGGAAATLAGHLKLPLRCVDELVLEGLARLAEENSVLPSKHI